MLSKVRSDYKRECSKLSSMLEGALNEVNHYRSSQSHLQHLLHSQTAKSAALQTELQNALNANQALKQSYIQVAQRIKRLELQLSETTQPPDNQDIGLLKHQLLALQEQLQLSERSRCMLQEQLVTKEEHASSMQSTRVKELESQLQQLNQLESEAVFDEQKKEYYLQEINKLENRNHELEALYDQTQQQLSQIRQEFRLAERRQQEADFQLSRRVQRVQEYVEDEDQRLAERLQVQKQSYNELLNTNRQLQQQLQNQRISSSRKLQGQQHHLLSLQQELQQSEKQRLQLRDDLKELAQKCRASLQLKDQQLKKANQTSTQLKTQLQTAQRDAKLECLKYKDALQHAQTEFADMRQRMCFEKEQSNLSHEADMHRIKTMVQDLEYEKHSIETLMNQLKTRNDILTSQNHTLEERVEEFRDAMHQERTLKESLQKMLSERDTSNAAFEREYRHKVNQLESDLATIQDQSRHNKRDWEQSIEKLTAHNQKLTHELSCREETCLRLDSEIRCGDENRTVLNEKLDAAVERMQTLEQKYESDLNENLVEIQELRTHMRHLQIDNSELRGELSSLSLAYDKLSDELQFQRNVKGHLDEQLAYQRTRNSHLEELYSKRAKATLQTTRSTIRS